MTEITKTLKLVIIGLIFLLGLHFTANFTHKDFVETFINEKKLPSNRDLVLSASLFRFTSFKVPNLAK